MKSNARYCNSSVLFAAQKMSVAYNSKLEPGAGAFSWLAVLKQGSTATTMPVITMPSSANSATLGVASYSGLEDYKLTQGTTIVLQSSVKFTRKSGTVTHSDADAFVTPDTTRFHVRGTL